MRTRGGFPLPPSMSNLTNEVNELVGMYAKYGRRLTSLAMGYYRFDVLKKELRARVYKLKDDPTTKWIDIQTPFGTIRLFEVEHAEGVMVWGVREMFPGTRGGSSRG